MAKPKYPVVLSPGVRVGLLVVVGNSEVRSPGDNQKQILCRCDCGNEKLVRVVQLRRGFYGHCRGTKSCGCLSVRNTKRPTHGLARTPEYRAWCGAYHRCHSPHSPSYANYGGRGISMDAQWRPSGRDPGPFLLFLEHVGPRPSPEHSLDRIDNNGNYAPGNVRWATKSEQIVNRRSFVAIQNVSDAELFSELRRRGYFVRGNSGEAA